MHLNVVGWVGMRGWGVEDEDDDDDDVRGLTFTVSSAPGYQQLPLEFPAPIKGKQGSFPADLRQEVAALAARSRRSHACRRAASIP